MQTGKLLVSVAYRGTLVLVLTSPPLCVRIGVRNCQLTKQTYMHGVEQARDVGREQALSQKRCRRCSPRN